MDYSFKVETDNPAVDMKAIQTIEKLESKKLFFNAIKVVAFIGASAYVIGKIISKGD